MIADVAGELTRYRSAVLTFVADDGYPMSIRVTPTLDEGRGVVDLGTPAAWPPLRPGRAGLLGHYHDEHLWNQRSVLVGGDLEPDGDRWILRPDRFVPGLGHGGLIGMLRMSWVCRKRSLRYFLDRDLPVPKAPWDELKVIKKQMAADGAFRRSARTTR